MTKENKRRQASHDRRMRALDGFLDAYEAEHGPISDEEIRHAAGQARRAGKGIGRARLAARAVPPTPQRHRLADQAVIVYGLDADTERALGER